MSFFKPRLAERMWCIECASIHDVLNVKNEVVTLACGHSRTRMTSEGITSNTKFRASASAERKQC